MTNPRANEFSCESSLSARPPHAAPPAANRSGNSGTYTIHLRQSSNRRTRPRPLHDHTRRDPPQNRCLDTILIKRLERVIYLNSLIENCLESTIRVTVEKSVEFSIYLAYLFLSESKLISLVEIH